MKLLLSFCLFFTTIGWAKAVSDTLLWSNQRLQWSNFKGRYDTATYNKNHFATTLWKLTYFHRRNSKTRQVEVIAYAWFDGRRSWVRPTQRTNTALLLHEQGHFDLAEILVRKFKKQIAQTTFSNTAAYADSLQTIFSELLAETNEQQERYDAETDYGERPIPQRRWQNYIATTLAELAAYADKNVFSKMK